MVLSSTWKGRDCVATLAAKAAAFAVAASDSSPSYAHRNLCRRSCCCPSKDWRCSGTVQPVPACVHCVIKGGMGPSGADS